MSTSDIHRYLKEGKNNENYKIKENKIWSMATILFAKSKY